MKNGGVHRNGLTLSTTIRLAPGQVSCVLHDEIVVLSIRNGVYYGLNEVAARVWQLLQAPRTIGEIRDILVEEYDVGDAECGDNVIELLTDLMRYELVGILESAADQ